MIGQRPAVWLTALLAFAPLLVAWAQDDRGEVVAIDIENDEMTLSTGLVLRVNSISLDGIKRGMVVHVEYDEVDGEAFLTYIVPETAP